MSMATAIIGRKKKIQKLDSIVKSKKSEFLFQTNHKNQKIRVFDYDYDLRGRKK